MLADSQEKGNRRTGCQQLRRRHMLTDSEVLIFRVCLTCETQKPCARCAQRKPEAAFGAAAWKTRRAERRICCECAARERGFWRCANCGDRQSRSHFRLWLGHHGAKTHGHQTCNRCIGLLVACRFAARTNFRLARLRARLSILESLDARIAQPLTAPVPCLAHDTAASTTQQQGTQPLRMPSQVHRRTAPTGRRATGISPRMSRKRAREEAPSTTDAARRPNGRARSTPKQAYHYVCPRCNTHVCSTVRTGRVDHRGTCGKRFHVHDGQVAMKKHRYCCPWCKTHVSSAIHTGRVDHRTVCGNQFHVQEGVVAAATRRYAHRCPVCRTVVWSSLAFGRLRIAHASPSGKPCPNQAWNVPNKTTNRKKGTGGK